MSIYSQWLISSFLSVSSTSDVSGVLGVPIFLRNFLWDTACLQVNWRINTKTNQRSVIGSFVKYFQEILRKELGSKIIVRLLFAIGVL